VLPHGISYKPFSEWDSSLDVLDIAGRLGFFVTLENGLDSFGFYIDSFGFFWFVVSRLFHCVFRFLIPLVQLLILSALSLCISVLVMILSVLTNFAYPRRVVDGFFGDQQSDIAKIRLGPRPRWRGLYRRG
jgi:hypothetical protein